jgi:hypothetical protein
MEWLNNLSQKCQENGQVNQQNRRHDQNYIPENKEKINLLSPEVIGWYD